MTAEAVPHERWMARCLRLARNGMGHVAPNPMVGAVLVQQDRILAEGWHRAVGGPHAEVECLRAFGDGPVPEDAVLYVDLEPCAHHGRTPPCADLLIARGVRHVVVGITDPDPRVAGQGIARLRAAGVNVQVGVLEQACRWANRRFLTAIEQQRPYVILKWAASSDGFLDQHPRRTVGVQRISSPNTDVLVHRWRSEEQAILVGANTVINDDPSLTVRHVNGRSPLRTIIDLHARTPPHARVFDSAAPTLLFTGAPRTDVHCDQVIVPSGEDVIAQVLRALHERHMRSLLVEGGAATLNSFIARGAWDEARVITSPVVFGAGTPAPALASVPARSRSCGVDRIACYVRSTTPDDAWSW